jgi:hypothetical protein
MNGMTNAINPIRKAAYPVFIGLDFAIPAAQYADNATGGVIVEIQP